MKTFQIVILPLCFTLISSKHLTYSDESNTSEEEDYSSEDYSSEESYESEEITDMTDDLADTSIDERVCQSDSDSITYVLKGENQLPTENCGMVRIKRSFDKVIGGKDSEIGAWPWLALLGYDEVLRIAYTCGGALITDHHVITAAHCLRENLISVRLGEFDLSCDDETQHLDINIAKTIKANFNKVTGENDLAILLLEETVKFTDLISPICLPTTSEMRTKSYINTTPFVAGWGHTKENGTNSKILQELQMPVLDNKVCYEAFKLHDPTEIENAFHESVLCAGDVRGGKDACQGDSGGPLMLPETIDGSPRYYIIGVVSRGQGCARKGMAGLYTKISYHMDWILDNLD